MTESKMYGVNSNIENSLHRTQLLSWLIEQGQATKLTKLQSYGVSEIQHRGTLHNHSLIWLEQQAAEPAKMLQSTKLATSTPNTTSVVDNHVSGHNFEVLLTKPCFSMNVIPQ
jgi:hypothetical protein